MHNCALFLQVNLIMTKEEEDTQLKLETKALIWKLEEGKPVELKAFGKIWVEKKEIELQIKQSTKEIKMKFCTQCKTEKSIDSFSKNKHSKDGLRPR